MKFVSLHNHCWASNQRFIDSINRPEDMVNKAIQLGFGGIAFTDHESLSAHVSILKIYDKIKQDYPDFKIIHGNEIYLIDESDLHNTKDFYHFILLAKDLEGWHQLCQLSSRAWERGYFDRGQMRVPTTYQDIEEIIGQNPGHICASSACFTQGHQVCTENGLKNIENIVAGDRVLTHDGSYQKVISPTSRKYNDIGYKLSFRHNDKDITCTKNHKFLVYHLKRIKSSPQAVFEPELIWKEAQHLKLYDKTLDLMPTFQYSSIKTIDISNILEQYRQSLPACVKTRYKVNNIIHITPELMRLYGLWLGDGSVSSQNAHNNLRVTLTFNESEFTQYYPFVVKGLQALGNFNIIKQHCPAQHKIECVICSSELAYLLRYISNDGKADTKFIYPKLNHISYEMDAEILYGYLLADGYFRTRAIKTSNYSSDETVDATVSQRLYNDISDLYYSLGFVPRSYTIKAHKDCNNTYHKTAYYHSVSCGLFSNKCNKNIILSHHDFIEYLQNRIPQHQKGKVISFNNVKYLLKTVKNIQTIQLQETVYCLNVENNHSFICNNIIVHNCLGGQLSKKILEHDVAGANNFVQWCIKVFGQDNFALEIQPSDSEEQKKVNPIIIKMANYYHLPYIVTTDSHYLDKEDFNIFSSYLNSKQSSDRETEKFYSFTYMMTIDEMRQILLDGGLTDDQIDLAIYNTEVLTAQIQNIDFRHSTIVPCIKIPQFSLSKTLYRMGYEFIDKFYDSADAQDRFLMYQIEQGLQEKNITIDHIKLERINTELDVLDYISNNIGQKLSAYLNLTKNIVDIAWQVSLVGPGRGSACGFYVNYLIGITQCDPLVYNLPYWRFLNKERVELPDVDEDFDPSKTADIIALLRQEYGEDNVLNCATFKTEGLKSAILNCGRGLGFNNDDMQALGAAVPSKRGITYTLHDCLYGDEERGLEPVPSFEANIKKYPGLFEAVKKIEGLPTNASIHASALYIFNQGYLAQNSMMRAPNKTKITAFNMHDSDDLGALKMDVLRTDAQSKMTKCLELLLKDKQIEWQGSLRATYDKYLHPDVLDYTNLEMWEKAASGEISNLFQFETQVGSVCIKKARPTNVMQLAEINSIMRLQVEGDEQPIDRYVRFRDNIDAWYLEMFEEGLNQHEIEILRKYLDSSNGVSGSQEVLMRILMDPEVCNFTLKEANAARKAIAKKQQKQLVQLKEDFHTKGQNVGARAEFLKYVWDYCIKPQLGYSFSLNHTLPYSVIAVQEMNLATRFNPLYWACACLCVNSGNYAGDLGDDGLDEENDGFKQISDESDTDTSEDKVKRVAPNYGKIAKAIADAQLQGVTIELPDINAAQADFIPDIKNNSILYSLRAVTIVSDELLDRIISGRPYVSWQDFYERIAPTTAQMLGLIKAGCFDALEHKSRKVIINEYLQYMADIEVPLRTKITGVQLNKALNLHMNLKDYVNEVRMYKFKKYIDYNQLDKANRRYVLSDENAIRFATTFVTPELSLAKQEYGCLTTKSIFIKLSAFERVYKKTIERLMLYLNSPDGLNNFRLVEQEDYIREQKEKYCSGNIASWEMQTMCFYHEPHELHRVQKDLYNIQDFNLLPEYPPEDTYDENGKKIKRKLDVLAGTVINSDNLKHIVSILTLNGVVNVKFFAGTYTSFNQKISELDPLSKKKTVIDDSFFKRGNRILVYGERRENMFTAKKNYSEFGRIVGLIEQIYENGTIDVRYTRRQKMN